MENLDETYFVVNLDNGHTLGFWGDTSVTCAEVVLGGDSMTMVVRVSRGRRFMIEAPMLIFTNAHRSYPIRGLDDTILGVTYKTGPKRWMDQSIFPEYFNEPRAFQADVQQRTKVVWLDNCSSHSLTPRLKYNSKVFAPLFNSFVPTNGYLHHIQDKRYLDQTLGNKEDSAHPNQRLAKYSSYR
jgi:hypothetical protein